jgi:hypothetical protein
MRILAVIVSFFCLAVADFRFNDGEDLRNFAVTVASLRSRCQRPSGVQIVFTIKLLSFDPRSTCCPVAACQSLFAPPAPPAVGRFSLLIEHLLSERVQ